MKEILANPGQLLLLVLGVLISFNVTLTALKKFLEYIADKTETQLDNKLLALVNKVSLILQKIIDVVGQNPEH